jgi:hypothetical protein
MYFNFLPKHCLLSVYYSFFQSYFQNEVEFWISTLTTYPTALVGALKALLYLPLCIVHYLLSLKHLLLDALFNYALATFIFRIKKYGFVGNFSYVC